MKAEKKRVLFITIVLIIAASALWTVNYKLHFNGFSWLDSLDYNQIARNIYNGNGFMTSALRPINFLQFQKLPHPELSRPPLYPYILAGFFTIFGVNDFAAAMCDGVFYVILVALTFLAAIKLSNSYRIALFSTAMVALSRYFLTMSIEGSSDIVYASFFMAFLLFYLGKPKMLFWHGIILGVLYILRINTIFVVVPWLFLEFKIKEIWVRRRDLLKFAAGAFIIITPYLIRNYIELGNPFFSMHKYSLVLQTPTYPGWTVWIQLRDISAWRFLLEHPGEILHKIMDSAVFLYQDLRRAFHPLILVLFLFVLIVPINLDERARRIRKLVLWIVILQTIVTLFTGTEARFCLYVFPVLFILCGIAVVKLVSYVSTKDAVSGAVLIMISFFILFPSISYWKTRREANIYPAIGEELKKIVTSDGVIASDIAWEICWYADRKTVWLPYDIGTMEKISATIPINYVFLSIKLFMPLASYKDNIWQTLFLKPGFFDISQVKFELVNIFRYEGLPVGVLYKAQRIQHDMN